eukprot:jgi/Botrbrau1/20957/Bobra.0135s0075.1
MQNCRTMSVPIPGSLNVFSEPSSRKLFVIKRAYKQFRGNRIIALNSATGTEATDVSKDKTKMYKDLTDAYDLYRRAPPSEKILYTSDVLAAFKALKEGGELKKWGAGLDPPLERRNVSLWELKTVGVKTPEAIGTPSIRNDAAFLFTVVGVTSVVAVAAGQLPGDWGFFVPYLTGGIALGGAGNWQYSARPPSRHHRQVLTDLPGLPRARPLP